MQLELGAAIAAGVGIGGLAMWAAWRYTRSPAKPSEEAVAFEPVGEPPRRFAEKSRPAGRDGLFETPTVAPRPIPVARPKAAAPPPAPASPRSHAERAPAMVLTQGVEMQDAHFDRRAPMRAPPAQRSPLRDPPPMKSWAQQVREEAKPEVPTEWARRQVGPVGPGRVAGVCGGCGSRLSVSDQRPLKIACPVCGRTKLVA